MTRLSTKFAVLCHPFRLFSPRSSSYHKAMTTNQQRFHGWHLREARFLNESHDQLKLLKAMTIAAMERSQVKEIYFKAKETHKITERLAKKYEREATKHRIQLSSTLSISSDGSLQNLYEVSNDHFDILYTQYMDVGLAKAVLQLEQYSKTTDDHRLSDFTNNTLSQMKKVVKELHIHSS